MLTFTVTPGAEFADDDYLEPDIIRALARPQVTAAGTIGNADLSSAAVQPNVTKPGAYFYAALGGVADAYTLAPDPALASLANGTIVRGKFTSSGLRNTGVSTLNVNGLGAISLTRLGNRPLYAGDLFEDIVHEFVYTSTAASHWELLNPHGAWTYLPAALGTALQSVRVNAGATALEFASNVVVQSVRKLVTTADSTTLVIPLDNSIPQIGEGKEFVTQAFTPLSASSKLVIEFTAPTGTSLETSVGIFALFQDAAADALAACTVVSSNNAVLRHQMNSPGTSEVIFKIRFGSHDGATRNVCSFNGATLGGVLSSLLSITEYL